MRKLSPFIQQKVETDIRYRVMLLPCIHLGEVIEHTGCGHQVSTCAIHGKCSISARPSMMPASEPLKLCRDCSDYPGEKSSAEA